jgi:hypothetical protein
MKINWKTGTQKWAFKNLVSHLIGAMPNHEHIENAKDGDITFLVSAEQIPINEITSKTIFHLDSNRWYEKVDLK